MRTVSEAAAAMTVENGVLVIVTDLNDGADKFWREKGIK